ncbi:glycoside hydrolase family 127 protein [Lederbergia sp. NSJ-179]|uniref:DUF6805 domain-containing protein n=1 Tax=Lederbergia sp. NSJ-179 TaxID=2931402 RepID=UPI001FD5CB93|nr:DUF6805 domain-containing protein [Lederbergia sp. NSJ-179]MCJ7842428.1 glycoside hydrolase family 127 protein [Lederbergia sp. NSJ-179]
MNLFIPSVWQSSDKKVKIKQKTDFPNSENVSLYIEQIDPSLTQIHIRLPYWVAGSVEVTANGEKVEGSRKQGYLVLKRNWQVGDRVEIQLPMNLHTYTAKDDPNKVGILYGPIVLAGALGAENFPEQDILEDHLKLNNYPLIDVPNLVASKDQINDWIKRVDENSLTFETDAIGQPGNSKVILLPFYEIHHQRYTLYWNMMDEEAYTTFVDEEKIQEEQLREKTVDFVQPGEQQPEIEHGFKANKSHSSYLNLVQRRWRDCRDGGFFQYDMAVEPMKQMYLQVSYFGRDGKIWLDGKNYEREFAIFIDGVQIAEQMLDGERSDELFDLTYNIPFDLSKDKEKVEVKFSSSEGKIAGGVYGVRIVNRH